MMPKIIICEPCMEGIDDVTIYSVAEDEIPHCMSCRVKKLEVELALYKKFHDKVVSMAQATLEGGKQDG